MSGKPSKSKYEQRDGVLYKSCTVCGVFHTATVESFARHSQTTLGIGPRCRQCTREISVKARQIDPFMISYSKIKRRAIDKNLPFDLTKEYLVSIWTGVCPVFGIEIKIGETGTGHALPNSAALDRLKPELGYVQNNVCWLSTKANLIKQNANSTDVMLVAKWMEKNIDN